MNEVLERMDEKTNVGRAERVVSVVTGTMVLAKALGHRSALGKLASLGIGGFLLKRGLTGYCDVYDMLGIQRVGRHGRGGIVVDRAVTVNKPRAEVYQAWRRLERQPFMTRSGEPLPGTQDLWESAVVWDVDVMSAQENERVVFETPMRGPMRGHGYVTFADAPNGRATEVRVRYVYDHPMGSAAAALGKITGMSPDRRIADDLRHFRQYVETGVISTVEGQSSGRRRMVRAERSGLDAQWRGERGTGMSPEAAAACEPAGFRGQRAGQYASQRPAADDTPEADARAEEMRSGGEVVEPPVTQRGTPEEMKRHYEEEHDL